ncbi:PLDc N-terminal domain-containing protein [Cryobacterium sp. CG_9.6]|uniref:PLDc N-terminal domain-containing protein n=1 Tax=Cryobacterium sp. CG_9.6 TaxID=2760710 RepID=UPI002475E731|nr:PLDc N-terminal domain-containing protein [Cryobacterium sp. CG_9.6]MDH6236868.1 putative membrane protein [Cryobacterium sp. CG_9.6]
MNPLLPAASDLVWSGVVVIGVVLLVITIVQISRAATLSTTARALWVLGILIAPVIGVLAWFVIGRRSAWGPDTGRARL